MKQALDKIKRNESLNEGEMVQVMTQIMDGNCADDDISTFLLGLSSRGETVDELTGAARVMRAKALSVKALEGAVDCCGTGGDMSGTYNISTAVAIVAAACGVPVAKHGNRSSSSKSGAADVLEALGVNLNAPCEKLEQALQSLNFAFLMAPRHHQSMKHVINIRKSLGVRTIFNLLGPLANPAGAKFQLLGVYDRKWLVPMAQTLRNLGSKSAWVVHGSDGLDEITTTGATHAVKLENDNISECILTPDDFGVMSSSSEDLKGGEARHNAAALTYLLSGGQNAYRDIVLANTSAVLAVAGRERNLKIGACLAADAIDSGKASALLLEYINFVK